MTNIYLFIITPDLPTNESVIVEMASDKTMKEVFCELYNEHVMLSITECSDVEDHYLNVFNMARTEMSIGIDRIYLEEYGGNVLLIKR